MFYLQAILTHSGADYMEIDSQVIAVSSSEERLQAIIDKTKKVQRPTQEMRGPSFDACASEWTEKVSEILKKENIPSACWPDWESDITSIYFVITPVTEV